MKVYELIKILETKGSHTEIAIYDDELESFETAGVEVVDVEVGASCRCCPDVPVVGLRIRY